MTRLELWLIGIIAVLLLLLTLWVGHAWGSYGKPVPENTASAPAVVQKDGSVVASRVAVANPSPPPHLLPKGSTEERRVVVKVQPKPVAPKLDASGAAYCDCASVTVDLSLVRDGDGRRVVASSPDGTVVSALDIPIESALIPPVPKVWAAGLSYAPQTRSAGVWLERDLARVRLGADLNQARDGTVDARLRVGWVF